jgi:hypothetical protein
MTGKTPSQTIYTLILKSGSRTRLQMKRPKLLLLDSDVVIYCQRLAVSRSLITESYAAFSSAILALLDVLSPMSGW